MTQKTAEIYRELTPWQTALVARHPNRPYTLDYVDAVLKTSMNSTVTVPLPMISRSSGAWPVWANTP